MPVRRVKNVRFPWSSSTYYMLAAELGPSSRATPRNHLSIHTWLLIFFNINEEGYRPLPSEANDMIVVATIIVVLAYN